MSSRLRVGVFDSGLGGLTVLRSLLDQLSGCDYVYLGDTARLPYGSKSSSTIQKYTEQNLAFLHNSGVDVMVVACNSASAYWQQDHFQNKQVITVIEPTLEAALKISRQKKMGLLATRATVQSQSYKKILQKLDNTAEIISMPAPLLVPIAEEGLFDDPLTNLIAYRYTQPLISQNIDTLILGCTHYPLLKSALQRAASHIPLIESGPAVAEKLAQMFQLKKRGKNENSEILINLSDDVGYFKSWAEKILGPHQAQNWNHIVL